MLITWICPVELVELLVDDDPLDDDPFDEDPLPELDCPDPALVDEPEPEPDAELDPDELSC